MRTLHGLMCLLAAVLLLSLVAGCGGESARYSMAPGSVADSAKSAQEPAASQEEQMVVLDVPAEELERANRVLDARNSTTMTASPESEKSDRSRQGVVTRPALGGGGRDGRPQNDAPSAGPNSLRKLRESAREEDGEEADLALRDALDRAAQSANAITAAQQGELWARPVVREGGEVREAMAFPLKHTAVRATVSGHVSQTVVTQNYDNPFETAIEAVYVFPLPENSAVNGFTMTIGERAIIGRIMRRADAKRTYDEAKARGWTTSLLEQERPNIFTQSIANIAPQQEVKVDISYASVLPRDKGEYTWTFPMVVGPRYLANAPDADRIEPAKIVPEGMRNGHDISVEVSVDAGLPLRNVRVTSHSAEVLREDGHRVLVKLADGDRIPNRDFVLRYNVLGDEIQAGMIANANEGKGHLSLIFTPPVNPAEQDITPREVTFVLDISGSMNGVPMDLCKRLMNQMLGSLRPHDTFNIFFFASGNGQLWDTPKANTPENVSAAREFLGRLKAGGGTEMLAGLQRLFNSPRANNALRMVVFMTDGYVGDENRILSAVKDNCEGARFFAFGIGGSINTYLINGIGRHGRGHSTIVYPREHQHHEQIVNDFFSRMDAPCLTDITVDWGNLPVREQFPSVVPDVFAGHPVTLAAAYNPAGGPLSGTVTVRGRKNGAPVEYSIAIELPADGNQNPAIASVWARAKIDDIEEKRLLARGNDHAVLTEQLITVALEHGLMSEGTSFVAVDESRVVSDGKPTRVDVPVEQPEGVDRDTTGRGDQSGAPGARAGGE